MANNTEDLNAAVEAAALLDNDALVAAAAEAEALLEDQQWAEYYSAMDSDYWSGTEQGMYDDDPNPYHGDYSEM